MVFRHGIIRRAELDALRSAATTSADITLPPAPAGLTLPESRGHFVSLDPEADSQQDRRAARARIATNLRLKEAYRAIGESSALPWARRSAARRLADLCDRLIEHDSGKRTLSPEVERRFRKETQDGVRTVGTEYFVVAVAKQLGGMSVKAEGGGATITFKRNGVALSLTVSPTLELTELRTPSGRIELRPPPTLARLNKHLTLAVDTGRALAQRYGRLPEGAALDIDQGMLRFTRAGRSHAAAGDLVIALATPAPSESTQRAAARRTLQAGRSAFLRELDAADAAAVRELRAGAWATGGQDLPELRAALSRMRAQLGWVPTDTRRYPPAVKAALERVADAAGRLRVAQDGLGAVGTFDSTPEMHGTVVGAGSAVFEVHRHARRIVLVARDADGRPKRVLQLDTATAGARSRSFDIDALVRDLGDIKKRSAASTGIRVLGPLAIPSLERAALDQKLAGPARRTAMLLLHEAGRSTVGTGDSARPLAAALAELLPTCTSGPRSAYASVLAANHGGAAASIRAVLGGRRSARFAIAVAAEAAGQSGDRALIADVAKLLRHPDNNVVRCSALALARLGDRRALQTVVKIAEDPKSSDRAAAAEALLAFGPGHAERVARIALKDRAVADRVISRLLAAKDPMIGVFLRRHFRDGGITALRGREGEAFHALERAAILGNRSALDALVLIASDATIPRSMNGVRLKGETTHPLPAQMAAVLTLAHIDRSAEVVRAAEALVKTLPASELRHHRTRLLEIARSRRLGLDLIERFDAPTREAIMKARESARPDGRKLAIVVYPKSDHNGAFDANSAKIRSLIDAGYRVMFYEARDVKAMVKALHNGAGIGSRSPQAASIIVLAGHGSQNSLSLGFSKPTSVHGDIYLSPTDDRMQRPERKERFADGTYRYLVTGHVHYLKRELDRRVLAPGGQVALFSCSTGHGGPWTKPPISVPASRREPNNVANLIRELLPHAKAQGIWAPMEDSSSRGFRFDPKTKELIEVLYSIPKKKVYRAQAPVLDERVLA